MTFYSNSFFIIAVLIYLIFIVLTKYNIYFYNASELFPLKYAWGSIYSYSYYGTLGYEDYFIIFNIFGITSPDIIILTIEPMFILF